MSAPRTFDPSKVSCTWETTDGKVFVTERLPTYPREYATVEEAAEALKKDEGWEPKVGDRVRVVRGGQLVRRWVGQEGLIESTDGDWLLVRMPPLPGMERPPRVNFRPRNLEPVTVRADPTEASYTSATHGWKATAIDFKIQVREHRCGCGTEQTPYEAGLGMGELRGLMAGIYVCPKCTEESGSEMRHSQDGHTEGPIILDEDKRATYLAIKSGDPELAIHEAVPVTNNCSHCGGTGTGYLGDRCRMECGS